MKNTWGEDVPDHASADCVECNGDGVYKTPYGCDDNDPDAAECEDEDNCYCDCHAA